MSNLRPFAKGRSGNPGGRPKGPSLFTTIRQMLKKSPKDVEAVARAYIDAMKAGSFPHLKEFIEREDGKVKDKVQHEGDPSINVKVFPLGISYEDYEREFTEFVRRQGIGQAEGSHN